MPPPYAVVVPRRMLVAPSTLERSVSRRLLVLLVAIGFAPAFRPAVAQSPFTGLEWRSIGPVNTSGRIDDIAVARVRGMNDAIYIATASSGVWRSVNGGVSFQPIFDRVDAMMSIGAVAVAPSAPRTVWVGTGEANTRQSSSWGDGVYRSTDGGDTWQHMGLKDTRQVARIVIDPTDPNIVYVAAQGHLWGPNADRGIFKTTDAGRTWTKVLFVDENTGANDLVLDPDNPRVLYAATYQRQRRTWGFNGGGPGSGIWKSTDAGATWTKLAQGLPAGDKGRIGLAIFDADPRVVYATVEAGGGNGGIYRTLDAGATWEKTSSLNTRPNYYSQIRIDAKNRDWVYSLGSNRGFYSSDDGGRTWTDRFSNVHGEDHALWVDPDNARHLIIGGDGGVSITWDRGLTWDFRRNMPIGQFYEVDVDNSTPFRVCGGLQDNGVWCMPSSVRNRNGIADRDAWNIGGGDGFHAHFDPTDDRYVIQSSQNGNMAWVNIETMERQGVRPPSPEGMSLRWNWDTPILNSTHDAKTWYTGAQVVFKTTNRGSSWSRISGDLTLNINRDTLQMMGAVVGPQALSRHDGQSNYGSLTSISESPVSASVLWTGSDDGQVQVTRDGGRTWTNVTGRIPGVPSQTYVSAVLASRFAAGRAYVTFDGHYTDDYAPYVFVTEDFGATWRSLSAGLPETSVNRIREHPRNARVLVVAHERGAHFTNDGGAHWTSLATNMPTVPVDDAVFQARDNSLVLGTHGRGIWILDDVGALETLTSEAMQAPATLLPTPRAYLMSTFSPQAWYGEGEFFAPSRQWDAVIGYHLRDAAAGPAEITVRDPSGHVVRTLTGPGARGLNRVTWDLRYDPPVDSTNVPAGGGGRFGGGGGRGGVQGLTQVGYGGGGGGRGGGIAGPLVMPGRYTVSVKVPGVAAPLSGAVAVEADPLPRLSAGDRATRQAAVMRIYDWSRALGAARAGARAVTSQRDGLRADLNARGDSLAVSATALTTTIDRAFGALNGLRGPIEGWSGPPTQEQQAALSGAVADARSALTAFNRLVSTEIPAAYRAAGKGWSRRVEPVAAPR